MDSELEKRFLDAYDDYADAIFRHCFFRVFSKGRAEELTQDTFLKTWEYLSRGKAVQNLRAFLYKVANNLIVDEARKKKEESLDALREGPLAFDPADTGRSEMERNADLREILGVLRMLPAEEREILTLRFVDDMEPREIAEVLGISVNNASVRINRALAALKDKVNR